MKKSVVNDACYLVDTCSSIEELEFLYKEILAPEGNINNEILGHIFEFFARPDENGSSEWVDINELAKICPLFITTNGGAWYRDNQTYLGKKYIFLAYKIDVNEQGDNFKNRFKKRLVRFKTDEEKESMPIKEIPDNVIDHYNQEKKEGTARSAFSGSSENLELDHKNGRYNNTTKDKYANLTIDDFQWLTKNENDRKREVCKKCRNTGNRFDATQLGYTVPVTRGEIEYDDCNECFGCLWRDPKAFIKEYTELMKRQD